MKQGNYIILKLTLPFSMVWSLDNQNIIYFMIYASLDINMHLIAILLAIMES